MYTSPRRSGLTADLLVLLGLLIVGAAIWLALGESAVLCYLGALLVIIGLTVAIAEGRSA